MSLRVVILIPSQKTDPHAHNRKAHTCHTHKAHSKKKKQACTHSLWSVSEAWLGLQSVLKSLPGVHSQPWTQEEGWEGETSKVNTQAYMGPAIYICHLEGERGKKKKMKQDAKQGASY